MSNLLSDAYSAVELAVMPVRQFLRDFGERETAWDGYVPTFADLGRVWGLADIFRGRGGDLQRAAADLLEMLPELDDVRLTDSLTRA